MLWFLLLLFIKPAASQENKFKIDDVKQIQPSPNNTIQLNVTWHPNDTSISVRFRLVTPPEKEPKFDALEPCQESPCLANFTMTMNSGQYGLQAFKDNWGWLGDFEGSSPLYINVTTPSSSSSSVSSATSSTATTETSTPPTMSTESPSSIQHSTNNPDTSKSSSTSQSTQVPSAPPSNSSRQGESSAVTTSRNPAIIGGAIGGGIVLILLIIVLIYLCRRRNRSRHRNSALGFNRSLMVKTSEHREVEVEMDPRPYSDYPYPGSSTASVIASDSGLTEKPTQRQREIDQRMQHLQDLLSTLESQPQKEGDESIGKVRDRIKRFTVLKEGDWAKEMSEEKPVELGRAD